MRLDASLGFTTPLAEVAAVARRAEEAGVAGVWTAETSHDPFLPLALAAGSTERLELAMRHGRWDEMAALVTDEMLDAFAVVAPAADVRASLERHCDGLIDRAAPYATFGTGVWHALAP